MKSGLLSYYKLSRAAKILKCDAEDILHWGCSNFVELSINLYEKPCALYVQGMSDKHLSDNKKIPVNQLGLNKFNEHCVFEIYEEYTGGDSNGKTFIGTASGLWRVSNSLLKGIESSSNVDVISLELSPSDFLEEELSYRLLSIDFIDLYIFKSDSDMQQLSPHRREYLSDINQEIEIGYDFTLEKGLNAFNKKTSLFKADINDLWITKKQLDILSSSIRNGFNLIHPVQPKKISFEIPHHSKERFASYREQVLKAAIYCREKYPVRCAKSFTEWASVIEENAPIIWPNDNEPPLTKDKIERILGAAVNLSV